MVDPDKVAVVEGDGVSAPDVLRVQVGDGDVLDDDVLGAADDAQALALDDTGVALAEDGLVRSDGDTEGPGVVAGNSVSRIFLENCQPRHTKRQRRRERRAGIRCTSRSS